jgi:sugar phosphate permease
LKPVTQLPEPANNAIMMERKQMIDSSPIQANGMQDRDRSMNGVGQNDLAPAVDEKAQAGMEHAQTSRLRWVIVSVLFVAVVAGFFDRISIAVLFNNPGFNAALGTQFHPAVLGLLMTSFLLAYALSAIFLSFIGDVIGPRRMLGVSVGIWGVTMIFMGACGSYLLMLVSRVILGLAEGPQFSLISKLVHRWFPAPEQARANAIWMLGSPVGSAIGFPLTIFLVYRFGWRASFYVLGLLCLIIVMPLVLLFVRDRPAQAMVRPSATVRGFKTRDFLVVLRERRLWLLSIHGCGVLSYLWGLNSWLPTYLARARHFNLHEMGIYSSLPFVLMFFGEILCGYISDKTGRRTFLCIIGMFGAGIFMYAATRAMDHYVAATLIAVSAGFWGFGLPASYALAMEIIPSTLISTGIGMINGIGNLVGALAPAFIGFIVARTGSFEDGLMVIVLASILCPLALLPLVRSH